MKCNAEDVVGSLSQQGAAFGPEVDGGSKDMRETWMLLEYADRGNLDRALTHKKFLTESGCLDQASIREAAHLTPLCLLLSRMNAVDTAATATPGD